MSDDVSMAKVEPVEDVAEQARYLHARMLEQPAHLFSQEELEALLEAGVKDRLIDILQELLGQHRVKLAQAEDVLYYQAVSVEEAERVRSMSADEAMVYSYIQAAGREGIWTRTIKTRSNLHQHVVTRCLKALETQRYIKTVKSVKYPTRKIYMLYHLQPSIEVTGGPWFNDSELDSEFIALLLRLVWQYLARQTFPSSFDATLKQCSRLPGFQNYPTVADIHNFVVNSRISTIDLGISDIRSLCEVLVYDGKAERASSDRYRATWLSMLDAQGRWVNETPRLKLAIPPDATADTVPS